MDIAAIFLKLLNMSFAGAWAVVIVLLLRLLFKKLPKKYICILWAVVLIRLLCPFTIPTLVNGQPDIPEPIPGNIMEVQNPSINSDIEVIDNAVNHVLQENFTPSEDTFETSANPLQSAMAVGAFIWCAGMIIMLGYTAWNLYRFYKRVNEAVPDRILGERIYRCEIETPVVTGVLRPRIYLPFGLKDAQLTHVLAHEKMHIQRKDHLLKLLFYIAVIVHWFNPFVWLAYRLLERDMEMACDEAVLEELGTEEKKNYCESLVELASSKNHFAGNPVAFGESDVKVRIKNLLNYKKPQFWVSVMIVIVIAAAAITCLSSSVEERLEVSAIAEMDYPLTKEMVEEALAQVNLSGIVSEEEYASEIRTSLDIRDKENRLIAGIASNGDGNARFLGINLIGYLQAGEATVFLEEERWDDIVGFATLLAGFEDKRTVYDDFINHFERESIVTEYQYEATEESEDYYIYSYEWMKDYGDVSCNIEVRETNGGIREIRSISFYNTSAYSTASSLQVCRNFLFYMFTSIDGRYENYVEATGGKYDLINRDEQFLESEYSAPYLNYYKGRVTENCLENMEWCGYFTLVDYLANQADAQVGIVDGSFTEADETKNEKTSKLYYYTATLSCEKDGQTKEFDISGQIGAQHEIGGWKIYNFIINDTEALSIYVTGESIEKNNHTLPMENDAPTIEIREETAGNYLIHIEDGDEAFEMPVKLDISFALDGEGQIIQDSKEVVYETDTGTEYGSVNVYLADERENMKFVWITINQVEMYSEDGTFQRREDFEYELTFRLDAQNGTIYDLEKEVQPTDG